ncbi:MAG: hypothetical protein HRT87_04520 [Legionellales bacterium]|nr:hypothetical protein [Legionellales bacterium]
MSEKIKLGDTYDLTKNIKGIELNTGFILGLERILLFFITRVVEDQSTLGPMFKKFDDVISGKESMDVLEFTETEANIYTIFALQQLLKAKAYEQKLVLANDKTIPKSMVKDIMTAYLEKDEAKLLKLQKEAGLS